jgi:hypothetical protein
MLPAMNRVLERYGRFDRDLYRDGFQAGEEWAEIASPCELILLDDLRKRLERDTHSDWGYFFDNAGAPYTFTASERLYFIMHPEYDEDTDQARSFWKGVMGRSFRLSANHRWLRGFADGALWAWQFLDQRMLS